MTAMEGGRATTEIPLVFPPFDTDALCYIVNDNERTIRLNESVTLPTSRTHDKDGFNVADEPLLCGSASVSALTGLKYGDATLTSTVEVNNPWILALSLMSGNLPAPVLIKLDLAAEMQSYSYQNTVKVQACVVDMNHIRLILCDSFGTVIGILLDGTTLQPTQQQLSLLNVATLLQRIGIDAHMTYTPIQSSMIATISFRKLLVAFSPFLVAVDIEEETAAIWSKSKCMEAMSVRQSTLRTLVSKGYDLIAGKFENVILQDMSPVSAIATAQNGPHQVFTLHADGTIHRWTTSPYDPFDLNPWEVEEIKVKNIPEPNLWDDSLNSILMTAQMYSNDQVYTLAIYILTNDGARQVASGHVLPKLHIVRGNINMEESDHSSHELSVHDFVGSSLVGMHFLPEQCSLVTFWDSLEACISFFATYGPSESYIVQLSPTLASSEFFLHQLAWQERRRIANLSFLPFMASDLCLEDAIHELDKCYMKYLFRPMQPRGNGSVLPPLPDDIRRALRIKCPSYHGNSSISIEVETILALHKQRITPSYSAHTPSKKAPRTPVAPATDMAVATPSVSIYDSLVEGSESVSRDDLHFSDDDAQMNDTSRELESYERRWKDLLLEIWKEENTQRLPICIGAPSNRNHLSVLVRAGCTSVVNMSADRLPIAGGLDRLLDKLSWKLVTSLESDLNFAVELAFFEQKIANYAENLKKPDSLLVNQLVDLASKKISDVMTQTEMDELSSFDINKTDILMNSNVDELLWVICSPESQTLPQSSSTESYDFSANMQFRLATLGLCLRCFSFVKSIMLGRAMILLSFFAAEDATLPVLNAYIHCVNVMWCASQVVSLPFDVNAEDSSGPLFPPLKKPSLGNNMRSILSVFAINDRTTCLDSLVLSRMSRTQIHLGWYANMTSSLTNITFSIVSDSLLKKCDNDKLDYNFHDLPELGIVPECLKDTSHFPKLALRLLSPFYQTNGFADLQSPLNRFKSRLFAKCLLIASKSENDHVAKEMAEKAFAILQFDPRDLTTSFENLSILSQHMGNHKLLLELLMSYISVSVELCLQDQVDDESVYKRLWSSFYITAIQAHSWNKAFFASNKVSDPIARVEQLKGLVTRMVGAGALEDLLVLCLKLKGSPVTELNDKYFSDLGDFYAIATSTLIQRSFIDTYLSQSAQEQSTPDYQGALYALHASQDEWLPAAQSMDLRFNVARRALQGCPELALSSRALKSTEELIFDDLALSSLSCRNAIALVNQTEKQYIVSGECERLPISPLFFVAREEERPQKRDRVSFVDIKEKSEELGSRLSRFMKPIDLSQRAIRCSLLRTLFHENRVNADLLKKIAVTLMPSQESDHALIDELFGQGHYHQGAMFARIMSLAHGSKINGKDLFSDAIAHLLCQYIVPVAFNDNLSSSRPTFSQLESTYNAFAQVEAASVLAFDRLYKVPLLVPSSICKCAEVVCEIILKRYASAEYPLLLDVSDLLLRNQVQLPFWLENMMIYGTSSNVELPGCFARRGKMDRRSFLGDASSLLSLYLHYKLYPHACDLVVKVLNAPGRAEKAAGRLPEKGDIDFVPCNKIDLLDEMIRHELSGGKQSAAQKERLIQCHHSMVNAVKRHFELLKISEQGQPSARALLHV